MYKYYLLLYSKSKGTHFLPLYTQSVQENSQFNSLQGFFKKNFTHPPPSSTALQEYAAASQQKYYLKGLLHYDVVVLLIRKY